ncbi:MAG: hypothetical protein ABL921_21385 [Pirellula sp.]
MTEPAGRIGAYQPLRIKQGSDYLEEFEFRDSITNALVDFTGYTAVAQLRKYAKSPIKTADFVCTFPSAGILRVQLSGSITEAIACGELLGDSQSQYEWDCEFVVPGGVVEPALYGEVEVFREVTRT